MSYSSGGKASFTDKGLYDSTVTYRRLDYVKYNNAIFVCKKTSLDNTPNPTTDTEYWTKFIDSSGSNLYLFDELGNVATQRDGIQFMNGSFTDDAQGNKTKVTIGITDTEWTAIQTILGTGSNL